MSSEGKGCIWLVVSGLCVFQTYGFVMAILMRRTAISAEGETPLIRFFNPITLSILIVIFIFFAGFAVRSAMRSFNECRDQGESG